jgi:peptide/nickel transport system permease protein
MTRTPLFRGAVHTKTGRVGMVICVLVLLLAFIGPHVMPYDPYAVAGGPFQSPTWQHWLGTDTLGRDAFSRFLRGGVDIIAIGFFSTALAYVVGIAIGLAAGFARGPFDLATVGAVDLALAFPPIVFILALLAAAGPRMSIVILAIALVNIPRIIRIVRAVTLEVSATEYVEAAVARGEKTPSVLLREIFPNILTPTLADFGLRVTYSMILFASIAFLGLALRPPAADWGLMISENRDGLLVNPWPIVVPAAAIALLTIGVNLVADAVARSVGRSNLRPDA